MIVVRLLFDEPGRGLGGATVPGAERFVWEGTGEVSVENECARLPHVGAGVLDSAERGEVTLFAEAHREVIVMIGEPKAPV